MVTNKSFLQWPGDSGSQSTTPVLGLKVTTRDTWEKSQNLNCLGSII